MKGDVPPIKDDFIQSIWRSFTFWISTVLIIIIMAIYVGLFMRNTTLIQKQIEATARAYFKNIVLTRRWNAGYGGVYVKKSRDVVSNPYLLNPDIVAKDGTVYTLKNPALMTREISDLSLKVGLFRYHITSDRPLNANNRPDEFESAALVLFKSGLKEHSTMVRVNDRVYYRYMAPLLVEESCLACHAQQGYRVNDIRGGISVTFDITGVRADLNIQRLIIVILSIITFIVSFSIIFIISRRILDRIRKYQERILALSVTDELTGLANKRFLNQMLRDECDRCIRYGRPLSCIIIDFDHFKKINDEYGHLAGDMVLKNISGVIMESCRSSDIVARYGGEEIVVLLPETEKESALIVAEKLRKRVRACETVLENVVRLRITISLGVSTLLPEMSLNETSLIHAADEALYVSKRDGRNRVSYLDPHPLDSEQKK